VNFKESVSRSLVKAIGFRIIGFVMCVSLIKWGSMNDILLALQINASALVLYIIYERVWNNIKWGRKIDDKVSEIPK